MTRQVRGADGRLWTVRERWVPPLKALPEDADIDDIEDSAPFMSLVAPVFAVVTFPVRIVVAAA